MKKIIFTYFLLLFFFTTSAQENAGSCIQFKTGKFMYVNDSSELVSLNRKKKVQEEINQKTGIKTKMRIRWTEDCTYELKQLWASNKQSRRYNGSTTKVIITKAYNDRYEFTCVCKAPVERENKISTMLKVE